jgi:outer membrane protein assembly factor BamB
VVEGKRLYVISNRGEVVCLDVRGQSDGNQGPFTSESDLMGVPADSPLKSLSTDGDIIWLYDMVSELVVYPHEVCSGKVLVHDGLVYAPTCTGVDEAHEKVVNVCSPSLIALDQKTGKLVALDNERIGERMLHGQWSAPVLAHDAMGKPLILYGAGDGFMYAFRPPEDGAARDDVQTLRRVWAHDCNPPDYRVRDGKPISTQGHGSTKRPEGPSEIIGTPLVSDNRVYVVIGQDPLHGPGWGNLSCLDAATGNEIWSSRLVDRGTCTPALADGLLYVCDYTGNLHCFDAALGKRLWVQDLGSGVWSSSPMVADGKVYVATENLTLWILRAGKEKKVLSQNRLPAIAITPVAHNGILYVATQRTLTAWRTKN